MNRITRTIALVAIAAVALLLKAAPGMATTIALDFTGTVTTVESAVAAGTGIATGDKITGTLSFDPAETTSFLDLSGGTQQFYLFNQGSVGSYSFSVAHPAGAAFYSDSHSAIGGNVQTINDSSSIPGISYYLAASGAGLMVTLRTTGSSTFLTSLDTLPTTIAGLLTTLGGTLQSATGEASNEFGLFDFNIDTAAPVASTPIPAALPLFLSAVGALGFAGWRRKQAASI